MLGMVMRTKGFNDPTRVDLFVTMATSLAKLVRVIVGTVEGTVLVVKLHTIESSVTDGAIEVLFVKLESAHSDERGTVKRLLATKTKFCHLWPTLQ